jgi:hypothetical protein
MIQFNVAMTSEPKKLLKVVRIPEFDGRFLSFDYIFGELKNPTFKIPDSLSSIDLIKLCYHAIIY